MNPFEFANPLGWWAALLAGPVILLYILKTRMRRQEVPTLLFWDQVFDEKRPRAWWRQLRRVLSLLLQLLLLALLVGALVDPLWSWQLRQQRRVVLVIDNSASMQAIDPDGQTRLALAKQAARSMVRSLRGADQMAILTAGGAPRVAIGMTDHQNSLLEAIDRLPSTDGPTAVGAAVDLAQRLLADFDGRAEIAVLSDACFESAEEITENELVTLYGVGDDLDNVAITRYQVRRSLRDATGYQVLIAVTNYSDEEASCRLELDLEGELVDVVPLELAAGQTVTRVLDHTTAEGGQLIAKLDVDDALEVDNRALALLPRREPIPVVLVTEGNLFLRSVLESIPLVALQATSEAPAAAPSGGVMVIDRKPPETIPSGRVLVVDPQNACDLWTLGEAIADPIVAEVDEASPLTRHVRLTNVAFPGARTLGFSADTVPLIADPLGQALFARTPRAGGDALVLSCNLEKGDLPLRIAFPVLMKNTIEWFRGESGDFRATAPSGQMLTVNLKPLLDEAAAPPQAAPPPDDSPDGELAVVQTTEAKEAREYVLTSPTGVATPIVTADERVAIGPLLETGLWSVAAAGEGDEPEGGDAEDAPAALDSPRVGVACNLASPLESDLRAKASAERVDDSRLMPLGGHSLWFYLTLGCVGLISAEWWLYQRRIVE